MATNLARNSRALPSEPALGVTVGSSLVPVERECERLATFLILIACVSTAAFLLDSIGELQSAQRWYRFGENTWSGAGAPLVVGLTRSVWPLMLAILIRGSGRLALLRACALAYFAMALDQALGFAISALVFVGAQQGSSVARELAPVDTGQEVPWLILSALLWAFETALARRAWRLGQRLDLEPTVQETSESSKRRLPALAAIATSVLVGLLVVGCRVWSFSGAVPELLSAWAPTKVDQNSFGGHALQIPLSDEDRAASGVLHLLREASQAHEQGFYAASVTMARNAVDQLEILKRGKAPQRYYHGAIALEANNLAWRLVTCEDESARDVGVAEPLARKAVAIFPEEGMYRNTLGVVYLRMGELEKALAQLERSMELRSGGDSFDWYFLAQVRHEQGNDAAASQLYDRSVTWMRGNRPGDEELVRFRVETAALLGINISEQDRLADEEARQRAFSNGGFAGGVPRWAGRPRRTLPFVKGQRNVLMPGQSSSGSSQSRP